MRNPPHPQLTQPNMVFLSLSTSTCQKLVCKLKYLPVACLIIPPTFSCFPSSTLHSIDMGCIELQAQEARNCPEKGMVLQSGAVLASYILVSEYRAAEAGFALPFPRC